MTTPPDLPRTDREPDRSSGRDTAAEPAPEKERDAPAKLSLTQVLASALAAVSTTVLLSYFGTAGTIVGAGIASALTVVANYVYTRSIQKTREQLVPMVGKVVQVTAGTSVSTGAGTTAVVSAASGDPDDAAGPHGADDTLAVEDATADPRAGTGTGATVVGQGPEVDVPQNAWLRLVDRYGRGRVLTATALALFVVVMGVVLVVELAIGKPISDAVRGVDGSGTTISTRSSDTQTPATPAPSPTTPAEDPTTVPTQDPAPTPTTTPTDEPTTTPTDEPTDGPTSDPTTPATDPTPSPGTGTGTGEEDAETGAGAETGTGAGTEAGTSAETVPTPAPPTPASS